MYILRGVSVRVDISCGHTEHRIIICSNNEHSPLSVVSASLAASAGTDPRRTGTTADSAPDRFAIFNSLLILQRSSGLRCMVATPVLGVFVSLSFERRQ